MPIKIVDESDVYVTQKEYDELNSEYLKSQKSYGEARSLEDFIKSRKKSNDMAARLILSSPPKYRGQRVNLKKKMRGII